MKRTLLAVLGLATAAGPILAQDTATATAGTCFRGRPQQHCRSFWITEAGYSVRLTSREPFSFGADDRFIATLEAGRMWNQNERFAIGLGLGLGLGTSGDLSLTAKPRVRYWLTPRVAIDVSPGIKLRGSPNTGVVSVEAAAMVDDRVGLFVQARPVSIRVSRPHSGSSTISKRLDVLAGIRLGSKLGIAGAIGDAVGIVVLLGTFVILCSGGACS